MRSCDGCKFCCWSFNAHDIPDIIMGLKLKPCLSHCQYECDAGCQMHNDPKLPKGCHEFYCPYIRGDDIHRPDTFLQVIEELHGTVGNYIPRVPTKVNVDAAKALMRETRSLPVFVLDGQWQKVILCVDRTKERGWGATEEQIYKWNKLLN